MVTPCIRADGLDDWGDYNMTLPFVSVVIPAHNEENQITKCLESVVGTGYQNLEIIVIDDNSTDGTAEVASRYATQVITRRSRGGIAAARNNGLQVVRGEIVAFVDADCVVDESWLHMLLSHYRDSKIAGVGGVIGTRESSLFAKYRSYVAREEYADSPNPVHGTSSIPGGNSSYRTDVLRSIGGFNPAFAQPSGFEELELGYRIRKHGYLLVGEPRAVVWHLREGSLRNWLAGAYAAGYVAPRFLGRYRDREFLGLQVKQIAFLAFLFLCMLSFIGVIHLPVVISVGAFLLLIETLRATFRSLRAVLHYRNASYLLMVPVELALTAASCFGYILALSTTIYSGIMKLGRSLLSRGIDTDIACSCGNHEVKISR
ncbi:glycosyltransferase family 2 protein [Candidatus Bathyarchaeota archaeon]|nr:glycosyltransferase family 2 protein [Candidatus Bathyarchaeota archaeon]